MPKVFSESKGTGGSGTPASPDTSVQFNNSGSFGGSSNFTYNDVENVVTVGTVKPTNLLAGRFVFVDEDEETLESARGLTYDEYPKLTRASTLYAESGNVACRKIEFVDPNAGLNWLAGTIGHAGDLLSIWYIDPGTPNASLSFTANVNTLEISLATDAGSIITTTAQDIIDNFDSDGLDLQTPVNLGDGTGVVEGFGFPRSLNSGSEALNVNGKSWMDNGAITTDGLGAITAPNLLATTGEISITTTDTLTIGRQHVLSGGSSYTATLPPVSGNSGKFISYRVDPTATKLYTIDGDGTEKIDNELNFKIWAKESGMLYCDGSAWFHIPGKVRYPMICRMSLSADQGSVANATRILVNLDTVEYDNTGLMGDGTNFHISILRDGNYRIDCKTRYSLSAQSVDVYAIPTKNSVGTDLDQSTAYGVATGTPSPFVSGVFPLVAGDIVLNVGYQVSGIAQTFYGAATPAGGPSSLQVTEVL